MIPSKYVQRRTNQRTSNRDGFKSSSNVYSLYAKLPRTPPCVLKILHLIYTVFARNFLVVCCICFILSDELNVFSTTKIDTDNKYTIAADVNAIAVSTVITTIINVSTTTTIHLCVWEIRK